MLKPIPMLRLELIVLRRDLRLTLHSLARLGSAQLIPPPALPTIPDSTSLPTPTQTREPPPDSTESRRLFLLSETGRHLREQEALRSKAARLRTQLEHLGPFSNLDLQHHHLTPSQSPSASTPSVLVLLGVLAAPDPARLRHDLRSSALVLSPTSPGPIPTNPTQAHHPNRPSSLGHPVVIATTAHHLDHVRSILRHHPFRPENLPLLPSESPANARQRLETDLAQTVAALDRAEAETAAWTRSTTAELQTLETRARRNRLLSEAESLTRTTPSVAVINAWVPAQHAAATATRLHRRTRARCVTRCSPPTADDEAPVLLADSPWRRPFRRLVEAYGLPRYREVDPTPFLALGYALMFGLMFGDVGHGAVLAIAGLGLMHHPRFAAWRDAGLLLTVLGVTSAAFGIAYGSCFGIPALHRYALWHDPLEGNPLGLLGLAIAIGITSTSLGLVLNVANQLARGDPVRALLGRAGVLGLVFYWAAIAWAARSLGPPSDPPSSTTPSATLAVTAIAVLGWLAAEPLASRHTRRTHPHPPPTPGDGFALTLAESAVHTLEAIVAFLANTTSFLRLAAYAMSHAALLASVWMMADALAPAAGPWTPASWLLVAVGNALVIALEGTVAAVQALRLHYYEFFSRFHSGQGSPFQPFLLPPRPSAPNPQSLPPSP